MEGAAAEECEGGSGGAEPDEERVEGAKPLTASPRAEVIRPGER
jgi:hypothetical protein